MLQALAKRCSHDLLQLTSPTGLEPVPIEHTFCPEVFGIEAVDPCHWLLPATLDSNLLDAAKPELIVVAKIALTDKSLAALAETIPKYLEQRERGDEQPERPTCNGTPKLTIVEPAQDSAVRPSIEPGEDLQC